MSTVPGPDSPAPADNHIVHTVSDAKSHDYGRMSAGGNATGDAGDAPAGAVPGYAVDMDGEPPDTGGTQTGPDIGHGATQVVPEPGATGLAGDASGGGTVGDSGPQ